jgi:hypothetical protein
MKDSTSEVEANIWHDLFTPMTDRVVMMAGRGNKHRIWNHSGSLCSSQLDSVRGAEKSTLHPVSLKPKCLTHRPLEDELMEHSPSSEGFKEKYYVTVKHTVN